MELKIAELRTGTSLSAEDFEAGIVLVVAVVEEQRLTSTPEPLASLVKQLRGVQVTPGAACLFDWWLTVRLGEKATALSYQLEDHFPAPLATELARLRDIARSSEFPILVARRAKLELEGVLQKFGEIVHHDQGKVGSQGVTWDRIEADYAPVLEQLRAGEDAQPPRRTVAEIRALMDEMEVRRGSDIWRKIERDWRELDETCDKAVELSRGPARHFRGQPHVIGADALTADLSRPLLPCEALMLGDLLGDESDAAALLTRMVDSAVIKDDQDLEWLSTLTLHADGSSTPHLRRLDEVHQRLLRLRRDLSNLRKSNVDTSEIEFMLELGDVSAAESSAEQARQRRSNDDRRRGLERDLDRLRGQLAALDPESGLEGRLDLAGADLADGALDEAAEALRGIREEMRDRISTSRQETALEALRAIKDYGGQVDDRYAELLNADETVDIELEQEDINQLLDAVDQARGNLRTRSEERCRYVTGRLENERLFLSETDLESVESALKAAEDALVADNVKEADGESRRAVRLLDAAVPRVWDASSGEEKLVDHIRRYLKGRLGFVDADIERLYVGLKTKRFAILSGLTGSGKTTIARLFAESLGATPNNNRFVRIAVRPNWVDETDVLGFVNPNTSRFEPGWLSSLVRTCHQTPDLPVFCLLDEMNLAPVEYYLADYLSAMEEAGSGAEVTTLTLYPAGMSPVNSGDWPARLDFPDNLFIIGTVNVDESTRPLSDRVLDRANVIQLSVAVGDSHHRNAAQTDLEARWQIRMSDWRSVCSTEPDATHHELLLEIADVLAQQLRIGLGVRSHVEIERYVKNAEGIMPPNVALDAAMLQRIIPKIRGFKRDLADGLRSLFELLEGADAAQCCAVINEWLEDSVSDDEFLDGTSGRVGLITG